MSENLIDNIILLAFILLCFQDGSTPLTLACRTGSLKVLSKLIALGADPMHRDEEGNSILLVAASRGHTDLIEFLLDKSISSVLEENFIGENALILAAKNQHVSAAVMLLRRGAEMNVLDQSGRSTYQYCAAVPGLLSQWVRELFNI